MMRNMDKAFYNEIPPRCWFCVFVETSSFFLVVVLKPIRRRNLSKCVPHMQPGYLSCLNMLIDLQLSSFLKLPTLLVNLSFVTNNTNHFRRWLKLQVLRFAFTEKVVFKVINTRNNHMNSRGVHLSWQGTKHLANCRVLITPVPRAKMEISCFFILQHRIVIKLRNGTFVTCEK